MVQLPYDCYCSELKVNPGDWETQSAPLDKDWYIYYRFYDPNFTTNPKYKRGKLVLLKGMNSFKTLPERQRETNKILTAELKKLTEKAYNPITGLTIEPEEDPLIDPSMPFLQALDAANKSIEAAELTKRDLKSVITMITPAIRQLRFDGLPIKVISRKYIKAILKQVEKNFGNKSAHRYNKLRTYLMMLFKELVEQEAIDANPCRDISKRKATKKLRQVLSPDDRRKVDEYLKEHFYRFWIFVHIFFHSACRITEIIELKAKHVNLERNTFKLKIKKDKVIREVEKPIKKSALPFWMIAMKSAQPEEYLFSKGLMPGPTVIKSYQITKRWNRHIKKKLGIEEDFYSLKHLSVDETSALLSLEHASALASHNSTEVTGKIYAVTELQRQMEKLKQLDNKFA